jgi:hypothetical protein
MASVLLIYWGRKLTSATALKAYALIGVSAYVATLVSVRSVLSNLMAVGLGGLGEFLVAAITNTSAPVQVSTAALVVMAGLLVRDALTPARPLA